MRPRIPASSTSPIDSPTGISPAGPLTNVGNTGQGYHCWNAVGTRLLSVGSCQVVPEPPVWKRDLIGVGWGEVTTSGVLIQKGASERR